MMKFAKLNLSIVLTGRLPSKEKDEQRTFLPRSTFLVRLFICSLLFLLEVKSPER